MKRSKIYLKLSKILLFAVFVLVVFILSIKMLYPSLPELIFFSTIGILLIMIFSLFGFTVLIAMVGYLKKYPNEREKILGAFMIVGIFFVLFGIATLLIDLIFGNLSMSSMTSFGLITFGTILLNETREWMKSVNINLLKVLTASRSE